MKNNDIRDEIRAAGIKLWQVAEEMGIADYNLSRRLRHELSNEEKTRVRQIIGKIRKDVDNEQM